MSSSHWEEFYATHLPPADFEDNRTLLKEFCDRHNEDQTSIVLVTVCNTAIPFLTSQLLYSSKPIISTKFLSTVSDKTWY